jgi:hypothetical protein
LLTHHAGTHQNARHWFADRDCALGEEGDRMVGGEQLFPELLGWDDVKQVSEEAFVLWTGQPELQWGERAWLILSGWDAGHFVSLWRSNQQLDEDEEPQPDDEILDYDITGEKLTPFAWIEQGHWIGIDVLADPMRLHEGKAYEGPPDTAP